MKRQGGPVRLGIVGCGRAAREHHLPAALSCRSFELAAAADTDPTRLALAADQFGIPRRFFTHRELLEAGEVDAVLVAASTPSHAEIGLDVLRAGKHMLMEKPLALTAGDCDGLVRAADGAGVKVLVAHNSRWHSLVVQARRIIQEGSLGPVRAVRSTYTHARHAPGARARHARQEMDGGVTINDGVHHFDLWRFLLDTEITQVRCDSIASAAYDDDTSTLSARLANGALASAVLSFSTSAASEVEIFGERGSLLLSLYRFDGLRFVPHTTYPGSLSSRLRQASGFLRALPAGFAALRHGGGFGGTYKAMWRHFAACLLRGETPACTLRDGRAAVAVALACVESARSGKAAPVA
ncbi:MAG: Gfo/Idh/MocA family oxidoreductase [Bryobacterales bacterium]|nr:Gfo/Idh/MocA family oxidoreductase [Bryobacterales bacterium]